MLYNLAGGREVANFSIEEDLLRNGYQNIAGIDESGRGALFGPVVAASVIFSASFIKGYKESWISEVDDSKLLQPKKRERLAKAILTAAKAVGVGIATNREIDETDIQKASLEAMKRAIERMPLSPDFLLVDGFQLTGVACNQLGIPHGDRMSISIAAASIVAKVLRDQMMKHLDTVYEGYAFSKHKGYGTRDHFHTLDEKGPTVFHRFSFCPLNKEKQ
jgi:ribonuclease HII